MHGVFEAVEFESTDKIFIGDMVTKLWSAQLTTSVLLLITFEQKKIRKFCLLIQILEV